MQIYMLLEMDDIIDLIVLGAIHKRRPQSGGFVQCGQGRRGPSDADICTLWCKKLRIFRYL